MALSESNDRSSRGKLPDRLAIVASQSSAFRLREKARRHLSDRQWRHLGRIKALLIKHLTVMPIVRTLQVLPLKQLIRVKENLLLTGFLDYPRGRIKMVLDASTQLMRLRSCAKEPETVSWIEHSFRRGDVLYDVGANVGAYSLVADLSSGGTARIYAFEPSFSTFAALCQNIMLNGCSGRVVPLNVCLSDETGLLLFNYANTSPGAAIHALGGAVDQTGSPFVPALSQPTLSYRLDDLIMEFELPTPTHLKIDTDGAELRILQGAARTLASPALRSIFIEVNEELRTYAMMLDLLRDNGFVATERHPAGISPGFFNYVFERRVSHS